MGYANIFYIWANSIRRPLNERFTTKCSIAEKIVFSKMF